VKKLTLLFTALALLAPGAVLANPPPATAPKAGAPEAKPEAKPLTAEEQKKALYVFGVFIAQRTPLGQADLSAEEMKTVLEGFSAAALGKPLQFKSEEVMPKVDQLLRERQLARGEIEKKKGGEFLAKAATEAGAQKLPSGLIYFETQAGSGESPKPTDTVKVHYKGTLTNGTEFDSSYKRGTPTEFPLNGVIKCWTEGVGKMKVGGKSKLICPADIAYGERGMGGAIPPNSVLVFEVELIEIVKPAAPAPTPGAPNP
jgi:FKBP-type peptidyl-prolyl cis-trans isomerase FkpA